MNVLQKAPVPSAEKVLTAPDPPNVTVTDAAEVKPAPEIVTDEPWAPLDGERAIELTPL